MVTEYNGYTIEGRDDFKIQEVSESMTLFLFNPRLFKIDEKDARKFEATLPHETNEAITLGLSELPKGVITLIINPTVAHLLTSELVKDSVIKFIFDHRIENDDEI